MPNRGDASTIVPRIIDNIPTPIRKNFAHPECLPIIPSTILAHPLKRSARPTRMVMTNAVHSGKAIVNPPNMSTSITKSYSCPSYFDRKKNSSNDLFNTHDKQNYPQYKYYNKKCISWKL